MIRRRKKIKTKKTIQTILTWNTNFLCIENKKKQKNTTNNSSHFSSTQEPARGHKSRTRARTRANKANKSEQEGTSPPI